MADRARAALYHRVSTVDQNPQLARRALRDAVTPDSGTQPTPW
jgi:hypothetical protein